MNRFKLNSETLRHIKSSTGLDANDIAMSDVSTVDMAIEKRIGTILKPAVNIGGLSPRGSVYLMFNRFITKSEINHQIDAIKQ